MAIETTKAIICKIGQEEYALDVSHVLSIERLQNIRSMPHTEEYMAGIMELRGSVVPVMNLRVWLGFGKAGDVDQDHKRIVVTESNGQKLGLIVDAATDVLDIAKETLQAVEMQQGAREVNQVVNLDGRLILVLNVPNLIKQLDVSIFDNMETA
ncbi:chemotaxis protein CheW [Effusibacillus dendaii]|uniref:Chemotaxis protein CheW n=1 Tax=Effusibacillus dendaii TaxID=2743772 RepID=A0A7I8DCQ8_9BACL|nr:chemotaxis protein CheW [Effusibacillus dendaii]BCJ86739.1 chemotaxis protein CheW [Effusibacillus dendaii]